MFKTESNQFSLMELLSTLDVMVSMVWAVFLRDSVKEPLPVRACRSVDSVNQFDDMERDQSSTVDEIR